MMAVTRGGVWRVHFEILRQHVNVSNRILPSDSNREIYVAVVAANKRMNLGVRVAAGRVSNEGLNLSLQFFTDGGQSRERFIGRVFPFNLTSDSDYLPSEPCQHEKAKEVTLNGFKLVSRDTPYGKSNGST